VASYQLGQIVTWTLRTFSDTDQAEDLPENPTGTVTLPDGTTAAATITKSGRGIYKATLTSTQAGRHTILWSSATANTKAPATDVADVWPANPRFIISLDDARTAVNHDDDDLLRLYIAATTNVIEHLTGPLLGETRVETYDGDGTTALALFAYPTAITSVVQSGVTLSSDVYEVGMGGILWRRTGYWPARPGSIVVTYTVGSDPNIIPPNVTLAAYEQLRHLWQVGRVPTRPAIGGDPAPGYTTTPMGFAVPNRVIELLGSHLRSGDAGGIA
jgi:hypothetical protein